MTVRRFDLEVEIEQVNGAEPTDAVLAAALSQHIANSGDFMFTVTVAGSTGAFGSTRWRVTAAKPGDFER